MSVILPSAVARRLPEWMMVPSHRTMPVLRRRAGRSSLQFDGGVSLPAWSIEWTAQPMAESSTVEIHPPCTVPIGL